MAVVTVQGFSDLRLALRALRATEYASFLSDIGCPQEKIAEEVKRMEEDYREESR